MFSRLSLAPEPSAAAELCESAYVDINKCAYTNLKRLHSLRQADVHVAYLLTRPTNGTHCTTQRDTMTRCKLPLMPPPPLLQSGNTDAPLLVALPKFTLPGVGMMCLRLGRSLSVLTLAVWRPRVFLLDVLFASFSAFNACIRSTSPLSSCIWFTTVRKAEVFILVRRFLGGTGVPLGSAPRRPD